MTKHFDAIVVGGGLSGAMAAMAMAREGLSVLLAEKSGSLGGAATVNYILPFMEYRMTKNGRRIRLNRGLFSELLDRLNAYHALDAREVIYNEEYLKLALDEMAEKYGVTVLFHATLFDTEAENKRVKTLSFITAAGKLEFSCDSAIDATEDALLSHLVGCPYRATIPLGCDNLLVVGRALSSTHEAQSSYRILPNVASIGEGAGIALSLCHKLKCPTYALDNPTLAKAIDAYDLVEREEETE